MIVLITPVPTPEVGLGAVMVLDTHAQIFLLIPTALP